MKRRSTSRSACWGVVVVALLALPACAGSGPDPAGPPAEVTAASRTVLASGSLETLPLRVEVTKVAREGEGVVAVECTLVNTSATENVQLAGTFAPLDADRDSLAGVSLLQESGPKRFFILRDEAGRPMCTRDIGVVAPGEHRAVTARFPAPDSGVEQLTIEFPGLPPFRNVPITGPPGTGGQAPTY